MPAKKTKENIYKRCGCKDPTTGRKLGSSCPKLRTSKGEWSPSHGTWQYRVELPAVAGDRDGLRRGGFATATDAEKARDKVSALLAIPDADDVEAVRLVVHLVREGTRQGATFPDYGEVRGRIRARSFSQDDLAVEEWLFAWLQEKEKVRAAKTIIGYRSHIDLYLAPNLGHLRLDRLSQTHVYEMFSVIDERNEQILAANDARRAVTRRLAGTQGRADRRTVRDELAAMEPFRRPVGASSKQSIRRTLRSALNSAIRRGKITTNAAKNVELPSGRPPKPMLWTPGRVELWRQTGQRPGPVMVWTPEQAGTFLDRTYQHRLYALYHLIIYRGPRRGEGCALLWPDVDLERKKILIQWQLVVVGWKVERTRPKTEAGIREVVLDDLTVDEFYRHRERQREERRAMGLTWDPTGPVFTTLAGDELHPAKVSNEFQDLIVLAGLPPTRMHDGRHAAATFMHGGGADLKDIQETLGHSSIEVTANLYTSVLEERVRAAAEGAARLVPRSPKTDPAHTPRAHQAQNKEGTECQNRRSNMVRSATHPKHPQPILPMMLRIAHTFTLDAGGGAAGAPTGR